MDLAVLEKEYTATLGSGAAQLSRRTALIDDMPLSPDAPILSGWEAPSSITHVSVRSLLVGSPISPPASKIGLNLNISAPRDDEALINDVVASPIFEPPISPELPSKKFALPSELDGGFTQWAPLK